MKKFLLLLFICTINLFPQNVLLNEIMPSNSVTLKDEDGDYSDWIEIYNKTNSSVDMTGYSLSDDKGFIQKWIFPNYVLQPNQHLLVFSSGKNRKESVNWQPVIKWGDYWKYFQATYEPSSAWRTNGFDDSSWPSGKSGFGYGDNDDSTITAQVNSVYIRKTFSLADTANIIKAFLNVDYDDGFVAYLNGVEIARANISTVGTPPAYNQSAAVPREALIYQGGKPDAFDLKNYLHLFKQGENVLAIQVHNYGAGSTDLTLIPFLTIGYKNISTIEKPHPLLGLTNIYMHTDFKISDGETIYFSDAGGVLVDTVHAGRMPVDISYERKTDGADVWIYSAKPSPGTANDSTGFLGIAGDPVFSLSAGFYKQGITVSLTPSSPGNKIYYTMDCTEPILSSLEYVNPINITSTTVVRAREINTNLLPGKIITSTYFIGFTSTLPVMELSTDPKNLFDNDYGIYVLGDSAETADPNFGANFWKDWERPININFFDTNGNGFIADGGVKIFGSYSRAYPQKSLALFARSEYGYGSFDYKLFENLPFNSFESFVLRNSGNDWFQALLRDALTSAVLENSGIDIQAYRPVVVFLNGQYWGIHDLREKVNEDFIISHHNAVKDSVVINEITGDISLWDADYKKLYDFISLNDMSVAANYNHVCSQMDIDEYISYMTAEIYIDNTDWPGNNVKIWRASKNGKWRWIMYDTDFAYGLYDYSAYLHNTLDFVTATNGPIWPNPAWSTLMLRKLLANTDFRNQFINRFCDFMNTRFPYVNINSKLISLNSAIAPEIPGHSAKWGAFTVAEWNNNVQRIFDFALKRPNYMVYYYHQKFALSTMQPINLTINDTTMGSVKINSITVNNASWTGRYFVNIPQTIIAQPSNGYRFVRWEGSVNSSEDTLVIPLSQALNLNAVFEKDIRANTNIVINELNYNSSSSFNLEDWIELFNNRNTSIDISGWSITDGSGHSFSFPSSTIMNSGEYLVVCRDSILFKSFFPDIKIFNKTLSFGFSGSGEHISLNDASMQVIDSLTYDDNLPWPTKPDGNGASLSLLNPDLDNSNPVSWGASAGYGTPGQLNDNFTGIKTQEIIPSEFQLYQNYPNPFNPSTVIRFSLPTAEKVVIKLYDILGNEIKTLMDGNLRAGVHETELNAVNLSSGVYFYRITAGKYISVKKMQVIK